MVSSRMLKLYYVPRTRAGRARWMLEELGVPYELHRVDLSTGEHKSPQYLAQVHPLGHVPALTDGDTTIFESAAIVAHLADRFPEKGLAPAVGSEERGTYYQWLFYAMAELEPHAVTFFLHSARLPEAERIPALVIEARRLLNANLVALETTLCDGREFVMGRFTAVDVAMGGVVGWAGMMRMIEDRPHVMAWSKRMGGRDAAKRSHAD